MSLKTFHIFFIVVSILLAFGFAYWEFDAFRHDGEMVNLAFLVLSFASAIGLIYYCTRVIKKFRALQHG